MGMVVYLGIIFTNMKALYILSFVVISLNCCAQNKLKEQEIKFDNFMDWWKYYNEKIHLSKDFTGLDSNNNVISKKQFLDSLETGKYLPIKALNKDEETYFLQKNETKDESITTTIKQVAELRLFNLSWEGKMMPKFNFTDLNGNNYTNENTKNKLILHKTYYVNCQACNEEMPELNKFIERNKNPKLLFLSLALDDEKKLKSFLAKRNYKYQFIANQADFINNKLKSNVFPTHFVIENGVIVKVVNRVSELLEYTENK